MKHALAVSFLLVLTPLATVRAANPDQTGSSSRPNNILVMPDDVGYGDYACLGNSRRSLRDRSESNTDDVSVRSVQFS